MKHLEVRQKYSAARRIFNSLLSVSSGDETLRLRLDILLQPDRKIGSGTVNGPIVRRTHILEYSWGLRTRNPGLSRRRTFQSLLPSVAQATTDSVSVELFFIPFR